MKRRGCLDACADAAFCVAIGVCMLVAAYSIGHIAWIAMRVRLRVPVLLLGLLIAAGGCASEEQLEPRFAPLTRIVEVRELPLAAGRVSTIYTTLYTSDLAAIDSWFPAGSVQREALLLHEQAHAIRQAQESFWLVKYVAEPSFRLAEEKIGWRLELLWLRDHGVPIVPWNWAESMATGYSGMITHAEAEAWVDSVLNEPPR